jgi:hypothetical protein
MKSFDTLTEAIADLKKRGYLLDFNVKETRLENAEKGVLLSPDEFEITEVYRFEGNTDPGDEAVLYAIESHNGLKGMLVNAYGPYSSPLPDALVSKLTVLHK